MADISQPTQKLIQRYKSWYQSLQSKESVPTIHTDEVASRVAAFYEKMRGVVDWREEHLMRRAAVERVLKRRLLLFKNGDTMAEPLALELIRGGHFPNDRIPETKIQNVQKSIDKYTFILENNPSEDEKERIKLYDWTLGIAACEIEEILAPPLKERALIDYMEETIQEQIKVRDGAKISEEEKKKQVYIAIQKALLKLDSPIITFNLLKRRFPAWCDLSKESVELKEITLNIFSIWEGIKRDLKHPLAEKFYRLCERYDTPYLIVGDVVSEDPLGIEEKMKAPEELESRITSAYQKRLKSLKSRVGRAAIYATLSIFISKILVALAVEVPFDKYVTGQFSYPTLGINALIPPLLMFFLILTIRPPRKENLQRVIMEVMKIVYARERKDIYSVGYPKKRGWLMNTIITVFYLLAFVASFGALVWGLEKLHFGILSVAIFLIFISLISFAGVKIRERSKELEVIERKDSFPVIFIDFFSMPIIQVGKWLSAQWARYNVIVVFINFLIDMPFQVFIEFLEQWRSFLKEKKEEIH
jgi:hypothetical protein